MILTAGPLAPAPVLPVPVAVPGVGRLPDLAPAAVSRLLEGRSTLIVEQSGAGEASLWLVSPRDAAATEVVWGQAKLEWVWPELAADPGDGEGLLLFAADRQNPIGASPELPAGLLDEVGAIVDPRTAGFDWHDASGRRFISRFWSLPLGYEFGHSGLTVLVSEPYRLWKSTAELRRSLLLLATGSLLLIALVGIRRLRSDLGPLEKLAEGARSMAGGDFGVRIDVGRKDEVGRVSEAFNLMANELERRFHQVEGTRNIAASALAQIPSTDEVARTFVLQAAPLAGDLEVVITLADGVGRTFSTAGPASRRSGDDDPARFAPPPAERVGDGWHAGTSGSTWRTLRHGDETLALVGLIGGKGRERDERTALLNGACDHLALAFAHVKLLEELDRANWGALTALARAVDAKSAWTHGHSVRVAEIAVAIASELGRTEGELRRIRRGCLVHDVGKIGVPNAVLDKEEVLDAAEIAILRSHVEKGARILEPVAGLAEVLPIVWQHHERIDGSGYPNRLRGAEIDPDAALVAVADVFEALTVARPYRAAWDSERVESYLRGLAGVQFDAAAVDALFRICERYGRWPQEPSVRARR